ncbi:MAG: hypothetical protein ACE3JP_04990 [Ectobacillus sp.]
MPFTDGTQQGFGLYPGIYNTVFDYDGKLAHDTYDVYVNEQYIGKKIMANEAEHVADIDDFLRGRGFTRFTSKTIGDHYNICVDESEQQEVASHVESFLNNR